MTAAVSWLARRALRAVVAGRAVVSGFVDFETDETVVVSSTGIRGRSTYGDGNEE
jgi:hypothetical protein